jgi:indolepyruvate ferredoxin oxidoreductase beta subunit
MKDPFNILVAGVGGQGNIVCGRILAEAAVLEGLRPVVGDTFGASRRGGSVTTHVRIGRKDWGPLIPSGQVHILLGLETMETYRAAVSLAGPKTAVLVADTMIPTQEISAGRQRYQSFETYIRHLSAVCRHETALVYPVHTENALKKLDSPRALNVYMVGVTAGLFREPLRLESIGESVNAVLGSDEINMRAFEMGVKAGSMIEPEGPFLA